MILLNIRTLEERLYPKPLSVVRFLSTFDRSRAPSMSWVCLVSFIIVCDDANTNDDRMNRYNQTSKSCVIFRAESRTLRLLMGVLLVVDSTALRGIIRV